MRKEAGFEVMNHINVFQDGNDKLAEILKNHTEEIKKEVLADNILIGTMGGHTKEWDINAWRETVILRILGGQDARDQQRRV